MLWNGNECGKNCGNENIKADIRKNKEEEENLVCFILECRMITNGAKCTGEIAFRIAVAKAAINRRRLFSPANWIYILGRNEVLHLECSFVWC